MSTAFDNKRLVQSIYEAAARGDGATFFAALDPEVEVYEPECLPFGGVHRGFDDIQQMFGQVGSLLEPGRLDVVDLTAEDDRVVALVRVGLNNGSETLLSEHWRVQNDRIVEVRAFWVDPTALPVADAAQTA
jgi:ketosteroid isomerase-like protein